MVNDRRRQPQHSAFDLAKHVELAARRSRADHWTGHGFLVLHIAPARLKWSSVGRSRLFVAKRA
jgi:hypothetical protein